MRTLKERDVWTFFLKKSVNVHNWHTLRPTFYILNAFCWENTPQGHKFWNNIYTYLSRGVQ